jgi:hypothetical protein
MLGFATAAYLVVGFDHMMKGEEVVHAPSATGIIMLSTGTPTSTSTATLTFGGAGFYNFAPVTMFDAEYLVPPTFIFQHEYSTRPR